MIKWIKKILFKGINEQKEREKELELERAIIHKVITENRELSDRFEKLCSEHRQNQLARIIGGRTPFPIIKIDLVSIEEAIDTEIVHSALAELREEHYENISILNGIKTGADTENKLSTGSSICVKVTTRNAHSVNYLPYTQSGLDRLRDMIHG